MWLEVYSNKDKHVQEENTNFIAIAEVIEAFAYIM